LIVSLETGGNTERLSATHELGSEFVPDVFDLDKMNRSLCAAFSDGEKNE